MKSDGRQFRPTNVIFIGIRIEINYFLTFSFQDIRVSTMQKMHLLTQSLASKANDFNFLKKKRTSQEYLLLRINK